MSNIKRTVKPAFNMLQAPYIKVDATVIQNGITNGQSNIPNATKISSRKDYIIAPSAKKIATYIVNQIFGSDLILQDDTSVGWLMPSLKEALELSIYEEEAFVYIHKFDDKIYLQTFGRSEIHQLVQKFDKVTEACIIETFNVDDDIYELHRNIVMENGVTYLTFKAYQLEKVNNELIPISIEVFNHKTNSDYLEKYILPYEVLINVDIGQDFFQDSKRLLKEEMQVLNVLADEIEKTRTRIVTSQHYQTGDIVGNWKPASQFVASQMSVGKLQDYFTLLPGDKEHQIFEYLQGNVRVEQYISTFKFYDYQCIQNAGLSPASFGYEKDSYMNNANIDLSKNNSEMSIEAIKTQIEPQLNKLFTNIVMAQSALAINENVLPQDMEWDYGLNENFDDMKKLQVLKHIQGVTGIPMSYKAQIVLPILNKLVDGDFNIEDKAVKNLIDEWDKERESLKIEFGEI